MAHNIPYSLSGKTIWVAGETGLVGKALLRRLARESCRVISAPHAVLDLTDQRATHNWLGDMKPDAVIMAAGRVGGIGANAAAPASFLSDNLAMAQNVIDGAHRAGVQKLLYLGSSCIYPKFAPQPIREESLLTGPLEETNEAYAIAKIAGLKLCQTYRRQHGRDFISAMPTNLYGPGDRFDEQQSHVIPALMMKIHRAKAEGTETLSLWGTGTPLREFMYVDDLADALVFILTRYSDDAPINIASGEEVSIASLAEQMKNIIGYRGMITFDPAHPDGTPRKRLDGSRLMALGWAASTPLIEGLRHTYNAFTARQSLSQAA